MENKLNQNFGHWTQHRCAYFDTWNFHRGNFSTGVYNAIREGGNTMRFGKKTFEN